MSVGAKVLKALPALVGLHGLQYIVPVLAIPFLMRMLGLERWGQVALLMTFGQLTLILLEYGFHMSATQAAARLQASPRSLGELFGAITAAKLLAGLAGLPIILLAAFVFPHLARDPSLLAWALAATILQAHDPLWFFTGTEQPNRIVTVTILARLTAVAAMALFIREPADAWIYFMTQAAAWLGVFCYGCWLVHGQTGFSFRDVRGGRAGLARGRRIFQLYLGSSSFDSLVPLVLGAVSDPVAVGIFVGADKLARAVAGLFAPLRNALFPRITALMTVSRSEAARLFRWAAVRIAALMAAGGLVLLLAAPPIVRTLLGSEAMPAVEVLRLLSPLPLLVCLNALIGTQWMVPCGMEKALSNIYIAVGLVRLALCATLGASLGASGAAVSVLCGEVIVLCACLGFLEYQQSAPWPPSR